MKNCRNASIAILSAIFCSCSLVISASASAGVIAASQEPVDYGVVAGAFAKKPVTVKVGKYTYSVIAPDMVEPACNSTQIVIWVSDAAVEGDAGGLAYNLGIQVSSLKSVTVQGDKLKISYVVNDTSDCSKSTIKTALIKYLGGGAPLEVQ